jgi:hypothetical protein
MDLDVPTNGSVSSSNSEPHKTFTIFRVTDLGVKRRKFKPIRTTPFHGPSKHIPELEARTRTRSTRTDTDRAGNRSMQLRSAPPTQRIGDDNPTGNWIASKAETTGFTWPPVPTPVSGPPLTRAWNSRRWEEERDGIPDFLPNARDKVEVARRAS